MTERVIATITGPELVFIRCAYFLENWTSFIDPLKGEQPFFYSTITPLDWKLPMVAVRDIGERLASEAVKDTTPTKRPLVMELHGSQRYSPLNVQQALAEVVGKKVEVKPVAKEELRGFFGAVFPEVQLDDWVEMAMSVLPGGKLGGGGVTEEGTEIVYGQTTLREAFEAIKTRL